MLCLQRKKGKFDSGATLAVLCVLFFFSFGNDVTGFILHNSVDWSEYT